ARADPGGTVKAGDQQRRGMSDAGSEHYNEQNNSAPAPVPTERFQRVLAFASDEADGLGHGFVTCQHLLYALSRESKGLATAVLEQLGITPEALHEQLAEAAAYHDRRSEEHTSELQSRENLVCRLLL